MKVEIGNLAISIEKEQKSEIIKAITEAGISISNLKGFAILKKSIDSRNKNNIKFIYTIEAEIDKKIDLAKVKAKIVEEKENVKRKPIKVDGNIVVIGAGPAGVFAALRLCEYGYKPIIFERGEDVDKRSESVTKFWNEKILNTESNVQYGEGGAGTFSDGKLATRIKSEYIEKVFSEFVEAGADSEILYDFKPHIGTDVLQNVVRNMRKKIESMGGRFYFESKLTDIRIENDLVKYIIINNSEKIEIKHMILAIGNSARETYKMLYNNGVYIENKDFAVGVRIDNPREDIDKLQYGNSYKNPALGAAPYSFTYNSAIEKRGTFTFCMCPGGEIVNASSEIDGRVTNGMSYSKRNSKFSNSAVIVQVGAKNFGNDIFAGIKFQEKIEKTAYNISKNGAVYQSLSDFMSNKKSKIILPNSYKMELVSEKIDNILPIDVCENLRAAFSSWSRHKLFMSDRAVLIGPETRTSAPIRIKRDINGVSISTNNLYPIGEGAGYAGGITSSAVDGIKLIDTIFTVKE